MARAGTPRPGRALALVGIVLVALYLGLFLGPSATPLLGLDLRGGTQVTLTASPLSGTGACATTSKSITGSDLDQAVNIIRQRVNGLGVGGATVNKQGSKNIVVSLPGEQNRKKVIDTVGQTALLRFRQVLAIGNGSPTPAPSVSTTVNPSSSPSPAKSGKAAKQGHGKHHKSSQGDALSSALLAKPKPSSTPSPTSTPTPTTSSSASPTPTPTSSVQDCNTQSGRQAGANSEATTLTAGLAAAFNNLDCSKDPNPTAGNDRANDYIIACGSGDNAGLKYLLAPASVLGTQVKSASAALDTQGTGQWLVQMSFNGSGSSAWQQVTAKAYNAAPATNGNPPASSTCPATVDASSPPPGCNGVAIVLDGQVPSAPYISSAGGIPGGNAQITGNFTQSTASNLADILKYGSLPLKFSVPTATSVSATLGSQQLRGGLIAGGIGLGLVIIFSLIYYRALGLVTVGSLAVSGLILYAVTTELGHSSIGYTLSLPGIAGFIVAVGITADSFVVFFERLRDETREGRRLRSAVEKAWPRARRTIISADTVSLLAAVVLYIVSIGDVRGFAFTLGLSTLSDLFIVFFFTRPLIALLARFRSFDEARPWTGVGRSAGRLAQARVGTTRPRSREA
ncbi:MAG TPA: protein translocase subunit SecD [Mycobacteriales bacterium]|nr:protein translocase subunit SecD [Mycobacteriales bacterium]